jgi:signal-transduction protein with cAMP-binding, CBS, and nucleotidyltransferase domain
MMTEYAEVLKKAFDPFFPAPIEAWEQFGNYCEKVFFKKDEIIKAEHTKEKYFYFIIKGSAGIFI